MLRVHAEETLPRLAWCARIGRDGGCDVRCGPWVERRETAFAEGAWSGDFGAFRFDEAVTLCGTGGRRTDAGWLFATPTDTLQPLFTVRRGGSLWVSNALPFLLVEAGCDLNPAYPYYEIDMFTVMFGLGRFQRTLPTRRGPRIGVHRHTNLLVAPDLAVREHAKPAPAPFGDFAAYRALLQGEVAAVVANAADPRRRVRFPPLATISSGYDSPAGAVLLRAAGCTEAFSFTKARSTFASRDDSGRAIGDALGLAVHEVDPDAGRAGRLWQEEARVLAAACGADDVLFAGLGDRFGGRLVAIGYHGDGVWGLHHDVADGRIERKDASGCSLAEIRLHWGAVFLVFPFIGCTRQHAIDAIARSAAMAPWRVGGDYDRPIPRRIVEEAGIPRAWFGREKRAAATPHLTTLRAFTPVEEVFGDETVRRFRAHLARRTRGQVLLERLRHGVRRRLLRRARVRALLARLVGSDRVHIWRWRYARPIAPQLHLTHWAVAEVMRDYARPAAKRPAP